MRLLARDIVADRLGWLLRALSFFNTERQITDIGSMRGYLTYLKDFSEASPKVAALGRSWPRRAPVLGAFSTPAPSVHNLYRSERGQADPAITSQYVGASSLKG